MRKRLIKYVFIASLLAAALYFALGAGISGGFGFRLPDGSVYIINGQISVQHAIPQPPPRDGDEDTPIRRLEPERT